MIREVGTVDDSPMSHGDAFTNKCRKARIDMNNGPVLNVRSLFDCYRLVICSNNNLIPDAGVFVDGDRADQIRAFRNKGGGMNLRMRMYILIGR